MAKWIQRRKRVETEYYTRGFDFVGRENCGYGFECAKDGSVDEATLNPDALQNYRACLTGMVRGDKVVDVGVRTSYSRYWEPGVIECECGTHVTLEYDGAGCRKCGASYNLSGQRLAHRSQWGEETGEHPADIEMAFNGNRLPEDW